MTTRTSATTYFATQGTGIILWWCALLYYPETRKYFQMGENEVTLLAFWMPDLLLLAAGSLAAAYLCWIESAFRGIALWFVSGLIGYASFYCLSYALITDTGWLGVVFMFPAMIWTGVFAVALSPMRDFMFRQSKPAISSWILTKTMTQIVVVWSVILVLFPYLITRIEVKLGISSFSFPFQGVISGICFFAISSLGVYAAYTMSKIGKGTPLPLDHAPNFVVQGPYAYVRNPMALSGIGQGIAVALFLGSPLVFLYALMGSLVWQVVFRPLEEQDLLERFGEEYENYCQNVKCWIPSSKPYRILDKSVDA